MLPRSLGGSTGLYAAHRCIRVETASVSTRYLDTDSILRFWPAPQSKKQLPRRRRKNPQLHKVCASQAASPLEKWLCWSLASRSSRPRSPAERSVPCPELGWSDRALTHPRAARCLFVSNAGGRRGKRASQRVALTQKHESN